MASPVRYYVKERNVQSFLAPGQPVDDLIWSVARTTRSLAKLQAGERTGTLIRGIGANRPKREGPLQISSLVYANARHALWHHDGTPTIVPKKGKYLVVPKVKQGPGSNASGSELQAAWSPADGPRPTFLARSINGQPGNPYLKDSLETALRRHPNLYAVRG